MRPYVVAHRTVKYLRGVPKKRPGYNAATWWDARFYTDGISDAQTIAPDREVEWSDLHYSSIERRLEHVTGRRVLDVGSGAGHWVRWWLEHGAEHVTAVDVSEQSADHLRAVFPDTDVVHGTVHDVEGTFDAATAIGVMFHIVDDAEWKATLARLGELIRPGGLLVCTGMMGVFEANVQIDQGQVTKRVRSKNKWVASLGAAGFTNVRVKRNRAWLRAPVPLPEAHVLTAQRR